jgi:hypothetical protein
MKPAGEIVAEIINEFQVALNERSDAKYAFE